MRVSKEWRGPLSRGMDSVGRNPENTAVPQRRRPLRSTRALNTTWRSNPDESDEHDSTTGIGNGGGRRGGARSATLAVRGGRGGGKADPHRGADVLGAGCNR